MNRPTHLTIFLSTFLILFVLSFMGHPKALTPSGPVVAVSVDGNMRRQKFDGFGATWQAGPRLAAAFTPTERSWMMDMFYNLFGMRLGYTLDLAENFMVVEANHYSANYNETVKVNDDDDPFHIEWSHVFTPGMDLFKTQFIDVDQGRTHDGLMPNCDVSIRFVSPWMAALRSSNYNRFLDEAAEYVLICAIRWRQQYGVEPRYVHLFNEYYKGNGEGWDVVSVPAVGPPPTDEAEITKRAGARLRANGFTTAKFVIGNEEDEETSLDVLSRALADPEARQYVGVCGYHTYPYGSYYVSIPRILSTSGAGQPVADRIAVRQRLRDLCSQYGIPLWLTEVSNGTYPDYSLMPTSFKALRAHAIHIHDEMIYADASAYFGMSNIGAIAGGCLGVGCPFAKQTESPFIYDYVNKKNYITGMGYAMTHYARWATPGSSTRINATSSDPMVQVTAFKDDARSRLAFVLINNSSSDRSIQISLANVRLRGTLSGEQSIAGTDDLDTSRYSQPLSPVELAGTSQITLVVPALSVTSLGAPVDLGSTTPPTLVFTQPTPNATISGTTVNVAYAGNGDVSQVHHVQLRLDGNAEVTDADFDGSYRFTGVSAGSHTLTGYLARADNTKMSGTDAAVTFTTSTPANTASFVTVNTATQGTWNGVYGSHGYQLAAGAASLPAFASVAFTGKADYTWASSTTDVRALQKPGSASRVAATWYGGSSFSIAVNLTDGLVHQVALYVLDWDRIGRGERIQVLDAQTAAVLDTQDVSSFGGGKYLIWNVKGNVTLNVTLTAGANPVVSGLFLDPVGGAVADTQPPTIPVGLMPAPVSSSQINLTWTASTDNSGVVAGYKVFRDGVTVGTPTAAAYSDTNLRPATTYRYTVTAVDPTGNESAESAAVSTTTAAGSTGGASAAAFVTANTTTQGTWNGAYGNHGYQLAAGATSLPAFASVAFTGKGDYTWAPSTTDVRALQKPGSASRVAATWYGGGSSFSIAVNLTDGLVHQVALYVLDWDRLGRAERIQVLDTQTAAVLDTQDVSDFGGGRYLLWNVRGNVTFKVTMTTVGNAVVSGIFLDPPGGAVADTQPPTMPAGLIAAPVSSGQINLTWTASTDNSGVVAGYKVFRDGVKVGTPIAAAYSDTDLRPATTYRYTVSALDPVGNESAQSAVVSATTSNNNSTGASASFVATNVATQGTWNGQYGSSGYQLAAGAASLPAFASVAFTGKGDYTWVPSTTDVRAPQKPGSTSRVAATWYSYTSFSIAVNLTDGLVHQVALYVLDWDRNGRGERIQVLDAQTAAVLDTQDVSSFSGGKYLVWNVRGNVTFKVTLTAGGNAVVSGLFVDPVGSVVAQDQPPTIPVGLVAAPVSSSQINLTWSPSIDNSGVVAGYKVFRDGVMVGAPTAAAYSDTNVRPATTYRYTVSAIGPTGIESEQSAAVSASTGASASFVATNVATQGTWNGQYGNSGYQLAAGAASLPAFASVAFTGNGDYTWASSTTDVRALQKPGAASRAAATWYSYSSFSIAMNLTDGLLHQVALYVLDWDRSGRAERIQVIDAQTAAVLDTQDVSSFGGGKYLVWNVRGNVTFKVTLTAGGNALVSGLFFDPVAGVVP